MDSSGKQHLPRSVTVVGLLLAVGILIAFRIHRSSIAAGEQCADNVVAIIDAREKWAQARGITDRSVSPSIENIRPFIDAKHLKCPSGGKYEVGALRDFPKCPMTHKRKPMALRTRS